MSKVLNIAGFLLRNGAFVTGVGAVVYGVWLIYQPAAFIIAGIAACAVAFLYEKGAAQ